MNIYLKNLLAKISIIKAIIYLLILIVFYTVYSMQPFFLSNMINVISEGQYSINYLYLALTFISFLSIALIRYPNNYFLQLTRKYSKEIIWDNNENKPYLYFVNHEVGEIQNLIGEISYAARSLQYESLQIVVKAGVMIVTYTYLLKMINIYISVGYLFCYVCYFILSYLLSKKNSKGIENVLRSSSVINSFIIDYYRNIETILTNRSVKNENIKFNKLLDTERNEYYKLQRHIDNSYMIQQLLLVIITLVIFSTYIMTQNSSDKNMSVLLILIYSAFNLSSTGKDFLGLMESIGRMNASLEAIEYCNNDKKNNIWIEKKLGKKDILSIKNISFSYAGELGLSNVNIDIQKNDKIAFIGKNGCGKTTLLKVIAGLLIPQNGDIQYNKDFLSGICDCKYYSQSTVLFDRSIYENMIYPKSEYNLEEVIQLVKELHLDSLIKNEEDLKNKKPGDFGTKFSGGEKQKIIIARAIINKAPLILFDEINSSLDNATDEFFNKLISTRLLDSTIICITHKNNYMDNFNKIFDVENMKFIKNGELQLEKGKRDA